MAEEKKKATYEEVERAYLEKAAATDKKRVADVAALDAQREDIGDATQSTLQQLYIQNERNKLTRGQAAKAAGLTGGALENAAIADQAGYIVARNDALRNRDKQLAQVDIAQGQTEAQAALEKQSDNVSLQTGKLSFQQSQDSQRISDAWSFIRGGIVTDEIAGILGYEKGVLQQLAKRYTED